jgi:hypothetical protein
MQETLTGVLKLYSASNLFKRLLTTTRFMRSVEQFHVLNLNIAALNQQVISINDPFSGCLITFHNKALNVALTCQFQPLNQAQVTVQFYDFFYWPDRLTFGSEMVLVNESPIDLSVSVNLF